MKSEKSIFTKIIDGEIPAHKIYEDDRVLAFLDIHPQTEGHTLVVPKTPVDHLWDMEDGDYTYLMYIAKRIGGHIKGKLHVPRVGLVVEGFGVPHVHVHLIPLYNSEDLKKPQDLLGEPDHGALAQMASSLAL